MRSGLFPGQFDELRRLARLGLDSERRTRRQLIASACAVVTVGVSAFWLGRRSATSGVDDAATDVVDRESFLRNRLPLARRLAEATDAELLASHATFLVIFSGTGGEPALWRGFQRLARMAIDNHDRSLAQGLLQAASLLEVPAEYAPLLTELRR